MFGRTQVRISANRLLILEVCCSFTRFLHEYDGGITSEQATAASFTVHHSYSFRHRRYVGYLEDNLLLQCFGLWSGDGVTTGLYLTPDGSDSCKLSVALQHSRGAHVSAGTAAFYSANKIYHLPYEIFIKSWHKYSNCLHGIGPRL